MLYFTSQTFAFTINQEVAIVTTVAEHCCTAAARCIFRECFAYGGSFFLRCAIFPIFLARDCRSVIFLFVFSESTVVSHHMSNSSILLISNQGFPLILNSANNAIRMHKRKYLTLLICIHVKKFSATFKAY